MFERTTKFARNLFQRSPVTGGGKDTMAEGQGTTANPPATSGGIDSKALADAIAASTSAAVAEAMKPLGEALAKLQPAAPAAGAAATTTSTTDKAKPLTLDDLTRVLNERDTQSRQSADLASRRQTYVADKLKDLPPFAATQLGNDPAKWPDEERAIRTQYRDHLAAQGVKLPDVSGNPPAATTTTQKPGEVVDYTKLNPIQQIELGLQQSVPARSASAGTASPVAATAGAAGATTTTGVPASAGTGAR